MPRSRGVQLGWARRLRLPGHTGVLGRNAMIAIAVLIIVGVPTVFGLTRLSTDTGPESFLPAGDPTLVGLNEAASSFGADPIVVLLESKEPKELLSGDQLIKLLGLEGKLAHLPDTAAVYGPATILNQIAAGAKNLMATVSGRRDYLQQTAEAAARAAGASDEAAKAAGAAATTDFDVRYGGLLAQGLPAGLPTLRNPQFVDHVVFAENGDPKASFQYVVPNPSAVAILARPRQDLDQAGTERLVEAIRTAVRDSGLNTERVSVTGAPAVAAGLGQEVRREIPILGGIAIVLVAGGYLLVPWVRRRRRRLLPVLATLAATTLTLSVFGWVGRPLSLGVITFLPILIGVGSDFPAYLVQRAGKRRVVVTACASAAGFGALAVSPLPFVRDLGVALAAGTLIAVLLGLLIRAYLDRAGPEHNPDESPGDTIEPAEEVPAGPAPTPLPKVQRMAILAAVAGIAAGGWVALPHLDVQARPDQLAAGLPAIAEALHTEEVIGSSGEIRVLVRGDNVLTPESLAWMRAAEQAIIAGYGSSARPIVSPPSLLEFLGPDPTPEQIAAGRDTLPSYLVGSVIRADSKQAILSFGVELQDLQDQVQLIDGIRSVLPPLPPGMTADVVGLPVAAARGYELVSGNRYLPNVLAIVAAALVLLVGLRSRFDALRAVVAASLATGWGLAAAWLINLSLTPLTVGLGSLTVAIACEFTVLLGHAGTRSRLRRTVGVAALSAAMGYLSLAVSHLGVIRQFGLLLAGVVVLSLLAAQLVQVLLPPPAVNPVADGQAPIPTKVEA